MLCTWIFLPCEACEYFVRNFDAASTHSLPPLAADYFGSGFGRAGTSPETQAAIDAWMQKNAPETKEK